MPLSLENKSPITLNKIFNLGELLGIRSNNDYGLCLNRSRAHFTWILYGSSGQISENVDIENQTKKTSLHNQNRDYLCDGDFLNVKKSIKY